MCACEWKEQTRIILRLNHFSIFHLSPSPQNTSISSSSSTLLQCNPLVHVFKKYNSIQIILLFFFVPSFHFHHIYKYEQDTAHYFHPSKNTLLDTTKKKLTGVPHCVRSEFGPFTILANPKSAIFMLESSVGLHSSKFSGFKSRCATLNE